MKKRIVGLFVVIFASLISIIVVIFASLLPGLNEGEVYIGEITDIDSVSVGGFTTETKCIIFIDGQKYIKSGTWCNKQIGDKICSNWMWNNVICKNKE